VNLLDRIATLQFGWRDALDILLVAFILYQILTLIRGTRAMQMAVGLTALAGAYFAARALDLPALEALTREILFYLPFAIIILFQHEIRRALASFGKNPLLALLGSRGDGAQLHAVVGAARELARKRVGALIAIERTQSLRMYSDTGTTIDALLSTALLLNVFTPGAPLHDGAVIVQRNRLLAAGCVLPLSASADLPADCGTRHRAAVGLSEETDAMVVVVSEENGSIAVAVEGRLLREVTAESLERTLADRLPADREVA
jgi:diadenylate cyclase